MYIKFLIQRLAQKTRPQMSVTSRYYPGNGNDFVICIILNLFKFISSPLYCEVQDTAKYKNMYRLLNYHKLNRSMNHSGKEAEGKVVEE